MKISLVQYSFSQSVGIGQIYIFYNMFTCVIQTLHMKRNKASIRNIIPVCGKQIKLRLCIKSVRNNG